MLVVILDRVKVDGQIEGVVPHLIDGGLSILHYVDDMILFMEHDLVKVRKLNLILSTFEKLPGIKISLHKCELFCFSDAQDDAAMYAKLFGYGLSQFHISYLDSPIHFWSLTNVRWKHFHGRLRKYLSSQNGKYLSRGGRLVLINLVLSNMVLCMISFFRLL
jgi:hypothetical protein